MHASMLLCFRSDLLCLPCCCCLYAHSACTLCAVASGSTVTVTCSKPTTGSWPEGSFTVTVYGAASQAGLTGCSDNGSNTTTVQVNKKPDISITSPQNAAVCSTDTSLTLNYTIGTGSSALPFNVTTDSTCVATPATNGEPKQPTVNDCWLLLMLLLLHHHWTMEEGF